MEHHRIDHYWHRAINTHCDTVAGERPRFMYEAKRMWAEVPMMIRLHREERLGQLPKIHQQCSHSPIEKIEANHLVCCLGKRCRECPHLVALEKADMPPEAIDEAKAWTCAAHIVSQGGDPMMEGYLLTKGDRMFWDRVYENLSRPAPSEG